MIEFKREDLHKLARSSRLVIAPENEELVQGKLLSVLNYATLLAKSSTGVQHAIETATQQKLPVRLDQPRTCHSDVVLKLAPSVEERYFVVPTIIVH